MSRLFGTDGVRGQANREITAELALDLSVAAAHVLASSGQFAGHRPRALLGRDPRASGEFLGAAVSAGLASAGVDVLDLGVLPTPAVAYLATTMDVDLGVMISASHNPMPDNGIKFFDATGYKLRDEIEDEIAARLAEPWQRPVGAAVGRIVADSAPVKAYVTHLVSTLPSRLTGLRVVVDCAHGAASEVAPAALRAAGAEVIVTAAQPDGLNINDGVGSTHPQALQEAVVRHGADAGVAFDGDADRCLAVDETGAVVDGDQIMGILALSMHRAGALAHSTLVTTVMSNLGLILAMREAGIRTVTTAVGDRYVLDEMRRGGFTLGGEQSGHILMTDFATTGDGTLTALQLLSRLADSGEKLSALARVVKRLPQTTINVAGVDKGRAATDAALQAAISGVAAELGDAGRVLLRPSGTEPVVRVMVEAGTQDAADEYAERLADAVRTHLALPSR